MIYFACPMCRQVLQARDEDAGGKLDCPKCGQRLQVPPRPAPPRVNKTVLGTSLDAPTPPSLPPPIAEHYLPPQSAATPDQSPPDVRRGLIRRYIDWCGTRSVIFQSLFLGWTAFMVLAGFGMLLLYLHFPKKT